MPDDEWREYRLARRRIRPDNEEQEELDESGCSVVRNDIHDRLFPFCEDILAVRPRTVAGLGVVARAASLSLEEIWDTAAELGTGTEADTRAFIENVCAFAGVLPVMAECGGAA